MKFFRFSLLTSIIAYAMFSTVLFFILQLRKLNCFSSNYQLRELYLQDNMLVELNGSLHHLTCLQVLLLNGNQLVKLTDIVHELKAMQCLKTLSKLSDNLTLLTPRSKCIFLRLISIYFLWHYQGELV